MRNSKIFFDGVFLSIFSNLELSKLCRKKLWGSKTPKKMACSNLVKKKIKKLSDFFSFFKLTTRKIFDYKEMLFYVAKSISFEGIIFYGQIYNFRTSIAIFNLDLDHRVDLLRMLFEIFVIKIIRKFCY